MKILRFKLAVMAVCLSLAGQSQLRIPVSNNGLRNDLQNVISEYIQEFPSIKGEIQSENPQTIEYLSAVQLSGSEECIITQHSGLKSVYSFQALMLTTEDFEEASARYKWLYNQLKGMTLQMNNDYTFSLRGDYDAPVESKKFSSSVMRLLPAASHLPKLKIEVSMQYFFPEWKVSLLVYDKEREDKDRGNKKEDE